MSTVKYRQITRFSETIQTKLDLISENKRLTKVKGTGVQFLPGYPEKFLDRVRSFIRNVDKKINILEIGGGGLIYLLSLIDESNIGKYIVIEPDITSTNYYDIIKHYNLNEDLIRCSENKSVIINTSAETFFRDFTLNLNIDVILCFRVAHFFTPYQFNEFITACHRTLKKGGFLIISAIGKTDYEERFGSSTNEFYINSDPIDGAIYYRSFSNNETGRKIIEDQNLKTNMLFFEKEYVENIFNRTGFKIAEGPIEATRIVDAYILRKE